MKNYFFLALTLMFMGSISVNAQTECPNIEWMRFFNNDGIYNCTLSKINNDKSAIVRGVYGGNPTLGNYNLPTALGGLRQNCFIAKVDSTGNPIWIKVAQIINNDQSWISSLKTDSFGNIYATICFVREIDFAGTSYSNNNSLGENTLLVKMNQQGQVLSTHLFKDCNFALIHVDEQSNYYCKTFFSNIITIDNQNYSSNGGEDILIFKLNQQGHLIWSRQIGGTGNEVINIGQYGVYSFEQEGIQSDAQNNMYIFGSYQSPSIMIGSTQLNNSGLNQVNYFIAKIDSSGSFQWVKGFPNNLFISAIAIDSNLNIYITGSITDTVVLGNSTIPFYPSTINYANGFLIKYDPVANQFPTVITLKGSSSGENLLYMPDKNTMLMTGRFFGSVGFLNQNLNSNNHGGDFYVLGVDLANILQPKWLIHSNNHGGSTIIFRMLKDFEDNIYLSGLYSDTSAFGNDTFPLIPGGNSNFYNGFQVKLGNFLNRDVTVDSGVLTAVQDSALYQWLDCNNGMQPISGATGQSFSPAQPGNYAVMVSNSLCSVVSDCINTTGISALQQLQQINIYPNPVQETLNLNHLPLGTHIAVFDVLGRKLFSGVSRESNMKIPTRKWVPGLYVVELNQEGTKYFKKVVKE